MEIVLSSKFLAHWDCSKTFQGTVFLHEKGEKEHVKLQDLPRPSQQT